MVRYVQHNVLLPPSPISVQAGCLTRKGSGSFRGKLSIEQQLHMCGFQQSYIRYVLSPNCAYQTCAAARNSLLFFFSPVSHNGCTYCSLERVRFTFYVGKWVDRSVEGGTWGPVRGALAHKDKSVGVEEWEAVEARGGLVKMGRGEGGRERADT